MRREQLEAASCIEDQRVIDAVVKQLADRNEMRKRFLSIQGVDDLFASMHFMSLASNDHEQDVEFEIEGSEAQVETPYYMGGDFRVIMREKSE